MGVNEPKLIVGSEVFDSGSRAGQGRAERCKCFFLFFLIPRKGDTLEAQTRWLELCCGGGSEATQARVAKSADIAGHCVGMLKFLEVGGLGQLGLTGMEADALLGSVALSSFFMYRKVVVAFGLFGDRYCDAKIETMQHGNQSAKRTAQNREDPKVVAAERDASVKQEEESVKKEMDSLLVTRYRESKVQSGACRMMV